MRLSALSAAVLALCAVAALPADAAGLNTASAAHRALYNLTLATSRGGDVVAARGTMGYEVIDACDGWAVRQRLSMTLTNTEGQDIQMVSDYATWESKDGLKFRFHMKQTTDTAVTSQTDGDAQLERAGGPGEAHYTVPTDTTKKLPPGTLFPMAHTSAILAAAEAGKKIPRPAAVRRHRRYRARGQLHRRAGLEEARAQQVCVPVQPAQHARSPGVLRP